MLDNKINEAKKGREVWLQLKDKWNIDSNWVLVIMPENDVKLNDCAIKKLSEYMKRKYYHKAIIIYCDDNFLQSIDYNDIFVLEKIDDSEMKCIVSYYCLQQFFKNIVVVSLEEPFGSKNVVGHMGISLVDYVENALFI